MNIRIAENIRHLLPECRLGYSVIGDVAVKGTPAPLAREFAELQQAAAEAYNLESLATVPRIAAVRGMYKRLQFDPSRYRPASEALIRRVLQNKGLYYVNSAVDVNNYCSLKFLLPFGLYDAGQVQGDVVYDVAEQGTYTNIAGQVVSTDGKPFLADAAGVFGNPTSDSRRTAVTLTARTLLSVVFADLEMPEAELADIVKFTGDMLVRYNGGAVMKAAIVKV